MATTEFPPQKHEADSHKELSRQVNGYCEMHADHWRSNKYDVEAQDIRQRMESFSDLLEPLNDSDPALKPAMTVCIPVALLGENQVTLDRVVDAVAHSQKAFGQPVEVILWTNTIEKNSSGKLTIRERLRAEYAHRQTQKRYSNLRDHLRRADQPGLLIKTALEVQPQESASISKVRSHYMEALAINAEKQGYNPDHPVVWLDADTTYLARNTLGDIHDTLAQKKTLFVHANERYTTEWADGVAMADRDEATRAVMISEIQRRKLIKDARKAGQKTGYPEESGLAFNMDTYLKLGGVNTENAVEEASGLLSYGNELLQTGHVNRQRGIPQYEKPLPKNLTGLIEYLPAARTGLSGRRLHDQAISVGALGIPKAEKGQRPGSIGFTYNLFSASSGLKKAIRKRQPAAITQADMSKLLRFQRARHERNPSNKPLSDKDQRIINRMVEQNFKDK
jgi:hypothetical protein